MIKAIIFDIGGVLLRTENLEGRTKWAKRFGLGPWELHDVVFASPIAAAATIGQATEEAAWEHARQQLNFPVEELEQFRADFWAGDKLDETLTEWVQSKRGQYRTGILSNAWPNARQFITSQPQFANAFEEFVFSAEEGLRKPQLEIYRRVLNKLGVTGPEAVFVDDVLENVEAAYQLGIKALQYRTGLDVPSELAKLGVV
jgi:HAD superfamily hydrolase (TIGR01509 family)